MPVTPNQPPTAKTNATTATPANPVVAPSKGTAPVRSSPVYADATLVRSNRHDRFSPRYEPIKLMFLSGPYAMQFLDLGCNSMSLVEDQAAEWEYAKGDSIRSGAGFKAVGTREFQIELDYYDENQDIRQLVEANYHMHEIGDESHAPPDLQIISGTATIDPLICRRISPTYDMALPGNRGYRHAVVRLTLEIRPEPGGKHDLAPVLSPTYLTNYKKRTNAVARAKTGVIARAKALLEPCLGEQGTQAVVNLIENNKLSDPNTLLQLDASTFVNIVAAGLPKPVLEDPRIQQKIKNDYALVMTQREDGMNPVAIRTVSNALLSGNAGNVPAAYLEPTTITSVDADGNRTSQSKSLFDMMAGDYQVITDALLNQQLEAKDTVFDRVTHPTASQRLLNTVSCGVGLRQSGGLGASDIQGSEAAMLKGINDALSSTSITDEQIKQLFGLPANTPETVIRSLRRSAPYESKEKFIQEASPNRQGFTSYNMWSGFGATETKTLTKINGVLKKDAVTEEDIKKELNLSSEEAKKLKQAGSFQNKESFLNLMNGGDRTSRRGEEIWAKIQLKE
jgi:hypothetical protein